MSRTDKFSLTLFGAFGALIVLPGVVLAVVSVVNTGSIDLGH